MKRVTKWKTNVSVIKNVFKPNLKESTSNNKYRQAGNQKARKHKKTERKTVRHPNVLQTSSGCHSHIPNPPTHVPNMLPKLVQKTL